MRRAPALPMSLLRGLAALPAPPFLLLAMLMRGCWLVLAESIGQTAKAKRYSANAPTLTVRRAAHAKSRPSEPGRRILLPWEGEVTPLQWTGFRAGFNPRGAGVAAQAAAPPLRRKPLRWSVHRSRINRLSSIAKRHQKSDARHNLPSRPTLHGHAGVLLRLTTQLKQVRAEVQDATQAAAALRQAETERRARGRWARIRQAWRGQ